MISFIAEAKSKTKNPNNTNGLQDNHEFKIRNNHTIHGSMTSPISPSSEVSSTYDASAIPETGVFLSATELERRMCLERLPFSLEVSLFSNDEPIATGIIRNVGGRGMFVETESRLNKGMPLQLCFTLMGNVRLPSHRVVGRVAHVTNEGVGVHLDVLKRDTLTGLQALKKQAGRAHKSKSSS
jgi:hypothetical protein